MHDRGLIFDAPATRRTEASAASASPGGLGPTSARDAAYTAPVCGVWAQP